MLYAAVRNDQPIGDRAMRLANLVEGEHGEGGTDTGYRVLTNRGLRRLEVNRHLLPPE